MHDDREDRGGGLAVVAIIGLLLFVLAVGGVAGLYFVRLQAQRAIEAEQALLEARLAAEEARAQEEAAKAAAEAARAGLPAAEPGGQK